MNKYLLTVRIAFKGQHGQVAMEINPEVHSEKASKNKLAKEATRILCELNEWKAEDFCNWDSRYEETIKSMKKQIMDFPLSTDFHGDKMIMVEPSLKRIKKTTTVNTRTNQGLLPVEMEEYKTNIESLKKYRLYCHKKPNGVWVVTEASTGVMIIDSLDNKKGLETRLADYEEKILARIEEMLKEYHIAFGNTNPEIVPEDEIYVESEEEKEVKRAERAEREAKAEKEVKESEEKFEVGELPHKIRQLSNKEVFNLAEKNNLMDELNNDTVSNVKNSWIKYIFIVEDKEKRSIEESFTRFATYFEEWKIKKFGTANVDKIVSELDKTPAPAPEVIEEIKEAVVSCENNGGNNCKECSFDGCNKESYELVLNNIKAPAPEAPAPKKRKVKKIGGAIYIHRSNVDSLDEIEFEKIWNRLYFLANSDYPCNSYDVIKIKDDIVSFIEVEGWDELREPIVGNSYAVKPDGTIKLTPKRKNNPQIYHHKWMFVSEDYNGFDVEKEKEWSKRWQSIVPKGLSASLGSRNNWEKFLKEYWLEN